LVAGIREMASSERTQVFDYLTAWSHLSDAELQGIISDDNVALMQKITELLCVDPRLVDAKNFISLVPEMKMLYVTGSNSFGRALLAASDLVDAGERSRAITVYKEFIAGNSSPFYIDMAKNRITEINRGDR
jgi:hypothetical protein